MATLTLATSDDLAASSSVTLQQANSYTTTTVASQIQDVLVPLIPPTPSTVSNVGLDFYSSGLKKWFFCPEIGYVDQSYSNCYTLSKAYALKAAADVLVQANAYTDSVTKNISDILTQAKSYTDSINTKTLDYINNTFTITTSKIADLTNYLNGLNYATQTWVNSKTWTSSQITDIDTTIQSYKYLTQDSAQNIYASLAYVNNTLTIPSSRITDLTQTINSFGFLTKLLADTYYPDFSYLSNNFIPLSKYDDFAKKTYVDSLRITDLSLPNKSLNMYYFNIVNVKDPINPQDVATKNYVDTNSSSASPSSLAPVVTLGKHTTPTFPGGVAEFNTVANSINLNLNNPLTFWRATFPNNAYFGGQWNSDNNGGVQVYYGTNLVPIGDIQASTTNGIIDTFLPVSFTPLSSSYTPASTHFVTKSYVDSAVGGISIPIGGMILWPLGGGDPDFGVYLNCNGTNFTQNQYPTLYTRLNKATNTPTIQSPNALVKWIIRAS